jgi:hypothetical protein
VYERFARQGQFLFRFIHQYYAEIRKELLAFIAQSRKEPQIFELLDPQSGGIGPPPSHHHHHMQQQQRPLHQGGGLMIKSSGSPGPSMDMMGQTNRLQHQLQQQQQHRGSLMAGQLPAKVPHISPASGANSNSASTPFSLPKLPPGITIQPQSSLSSRRNSSSDAASSGQPATHQPAVTIKTEKGEPVAGIGLSQLASAATESSSAYKTQSAASNVGTAIAIQ